MSNAFENTANQVAANSAALIAKLQLFTSTTGIFESSTNTKGNFKASTNTTAPLTQAQRDAITNTCDDLEDLLRNYQ